MVHPLHHVFVHIKSSELQLNERFLSGFCGLCDNTLPLVWNCSNPVQSQNSFQFQLWIQVEDNNPLHAQVCMVVCVGVCVCTWSNFCGMESIVQHKFQLGIKDQMLNKDK